MEVPDLLARSMIGLMRLALIGVVTIVAMTPFCSSNLAMSIMGMKCRGDRHEWNEKKMKPMGF